MIIDEESYDSLEHYGTKRHSGRYPWGSGGNGDGSEVKGNAFLKLVSELRGQGLTDKEIYEGLGISSTRFRARNTIANAEEKQAKITQALHLKEKGMSGVAAAAQMGIPEATFRTLIAPNAQDRIDVLFKTSNMLKQQVDEKGFIDIGTGVENYLGMSGEKLRAAVAILEEEGYRVHKVPVPQLGTRHDTSIKTLTRPGTTWGDAKRNQDNIQSLTSFTEDGGHTFIKTHDPISINPNRLTVKYKEDGGAEADGVIYIRPGVEDVSIGKNRYAQVRVQVGDGHYLKGMAMYKDDLPPGVDLMFNTNKSSTGNKLDALKKISDKDPDLPFGAIVRQIVADPGTPKERVTSAMNIVGSKPGAGEEGSWQGWSKNLSTQFLSKQRPELAQAQLDTTFERRRKELDEILALTNPTVKRKLLEDFAEDTDSAAVHLNAAKFPRQNWHVILPVNSLQPTQIYAPNYRDGEKVVLVRYPHGGTFEIPELTVNNRHGPAKKLLGPNPPDVVGIHHSVAERLSGADFDGDTVLVIPQTGRKRITHTPALDKLKGFDPKSEYKGYDGMPGINTQMEMGKISNLITDMTLKGAPHDDLVRAIKHSMVVIDAEKHGLDYRRSAIDNGITALKIKYQEKANAGASTLISRASSRKDIPERRARPSKEGGPINRVTGAREFVPTGNKRVNAKGQLVDKMERTTKLAVEPDAHKLSSGTRIETIYADHSNRLKALANEARLTMINTPRLERSPSAARVYAKEVADLNAKLNIAVKNRPLERQAQVIANANVRLKRKANPDMSDETRKKIEFQELERARLRLGANKKTKQIDITPKEWEAIQQGAISDSKLEDILKNTDTDVVRKLATPRKEVLMTPTATRRAAQMLAAGYTRADVADRLGVSLTTLDLATNT